MSEGCSHFKNLNYLINSGETLSNANWLLILLLRIFSSVLRALLYMRYLYLSRFYYEVDGLFIFFFFHFLLATCLTLPGSSFMFTAKVMQNNLCLEG